MLFSKKTAPNPVPPSPAAGLKILISRGSRGAWEKLTRSGGCYDPRGCWTRRLPAAPERRGARPQEEPAPAARGACVLQLLASAARRGRLASALCLWNPARLAARLLFSGRSGAHRAPSLAGFGTNRIGHNQDWGGPRSCSARGLGVILGWWGGGVLSSPLGSVI